VVWESCHFSTNGNLGSCPLRDVVSTRSHTWGTGKSCEPGQLSGQVYSAVTTPCWTSQRFLS
jgi:hypothetical protein